MLNIKLTIEYDGKKYFGWQRQKNKPTVQQSIEEALQLLFSGEKITLIGAGRTDTGVHAYGQVANFKIKKSSLKVKLKDLIHILNAMLPQDITIKKAELVEQDFHSRYSAKARIYKYYVTETKRSVNADKYLFIKTKFDIALAKEYCKLLTGIHCFRSLCKNDTDKHDFQADVKYVKVSRKRDGIIEFEICANRFLHSMVRAIIGAMIKVASGKMELKEFKNKFEKGEEIKAQYVRSNALFLYKIIY
ncbi:MAG: tRNA pseudouridine(38-40) synthase TruA [Ignavibacteriae bacterium]|nr:MAG: tRNA pseudouridine(38-40) synthase TruA [Ignavibacteriota bacterium]